MSTPASNTPGTATPGSTAPTNTTHPGSTAPTNTTHPGSTAPTNTTHPHTNTPAPATLRSSRAAVTTIFALQGMLLAAILSSLPAIRNALNTTDALLAILIGAVCVLAAGGSVIAEKLAERKNSSTALTTGIILLITGGTAATLNQGLATFLAAIMIYGLGVGAIDAAGNMQAAALQQRIGKVILGSFFAAWSGGAILGAVVVSATEAAMPTNPQAYRISIGIVVALVAIAGLLARPRFLRYGRQPHVNMDPVKVVLPWRPLVLLGLAMTLFFAIDFGLSNWSPLLLHDALHASTATAAMGVAAYQIASFITRLTTDAWTRRFGPVTVVRAGGVIAVAGMALTIAAPNVATALAGLAIVGLGAPVVAPLCFSSATVLAGEDSLDVIIARLNLFNYAGTVTGGVVIGTVLALTNARVAFVIPLLGAAGLVVLAKAFAKQGGASAGVPGGTPGAE